MKKRWKVLSPDKGLAKTLAGRLDILPLTATLLLNRGVSDPDSARSYLYPSLKNISDPHLLKDMDKACARVADAIVRKEKIAVYGDYDVDGATSSALLYLFFRELGAEPLCYIPERASEGYGLNKGALEKLHALGARLVITVDCGSSNHDEALFAANLGMDLIITDHHELALGAPEAFAIINPRQKDCRYPFKGLAGVGVAFNLAMAVRARLRETGFFEERPEPNLAKYLDLVAIGTIADMAPLVEENRVFASLGLKQLEKTGRAGLRALIELACPRGNAPDAATVAFNIAPRLNAAGRIGHAQTALDLLTTDDPAVGASLAKALDSGNATRQRIEGAMLEEALAMIGDPAGKKGFVLSKEGWHPGVIGIVASKIVDRFCRPAVLIALANGVGKGSARGIKAFDMISALSACSRTLDKFGGHKGAAGLTVKGSMIGEFQMAFLRHVEGALTDDDLVPEVPLDGIVSLAEMDGRFAREASMLEPFGVANPEPVLCVPGARVSASEVVGLRHLKFRVEQDGCARRAIGFGLASLHPMNDGPYGIAFTPLYESWQGTRTLKLKIRDVQKDAVILPG